MSALQTWLTKPRATVRIDTSVAWASTPWAAWMKALRRPFAPKQVEDKVRIEVLDRLSLGGKKSLVLVSIEGQRLLVGVGENAAPSIESLSALEMRSTPSTASRTLRNTVRRRSSR